MFFVKFVEASLFRFSHDSLSIEATWESGGNKRLVKLWLLSFFCRAAASFNKPLHADSVRAVGYRAGSCLTILHATRHRVHCG